MAEPTLIKASTTKKNQEGDDVRVEASFEYTYPDTIQEFVDQYGEDTVKHAAIQYFNTKGQNDLRRELQETESAEEAQQVAEGLTDKFEGSWSPESTHSVAGDPKRNAVKAFEKMSAEERAAFIEELRQVDQG